MPEDAAEADIGETVAWDDDGAGAAETTVVPASTEAATQLAWSRDAADVDDERPHRSWRVALVSAVAVLVVSGCIALVIAVWPRRHDDSALQGGIVEPSAMPSAPRPSAAPPETPRSVSAEPPPPAAATVAPPTSTVIVEAAPPPPIPSSPARPPADADRIFREGVAGIPQLYIVNWDVAEAGARSICGGFARGLSRAEIFDEVQRNDPTFLPWQSSAIINVSLAAYCPQYEE